MKASCLYPSLNVAEQLEHANTTKKKFLRILKIVTMVKKYHLNILNSFSKVWIQFCNPMFNFSYNTYYIPLGSVVWKKMTDVGWPFNAKFTDSCHFIDKFNSVSKSDGSYCQCHFWQITTKIWQMSTVIWQKWQAIGGKCCDFSESNSNTTVIFTIKCGEI